MARKKIDWDSNMMDLLYDLNRYPKSKTTKKNYMFQYGLTEIQYNAVRRKNRSIRKSIRKK